MTGVEMIIREREEQLTKHDRSIENDVRYNGNGALMHAAVGLTINLDMYRPRHWDENIWRHMQDKPYLERLVIAGALIAAEIDRIQYKK